MSVPRIATPVRARLLALAALAASAFAALPAAAQGRDGLGADIKAYVSAPLHWDGKHWLGFGGTLAAISAAYQYDDRVRDHFVPAGAGVDPDQNTYDAHDAIPAALALGGTWIYAAIIDSTDGRREAGTMLEGAALASATSFLLKQAVGRERPFETTEPGRWREGGDSFPSTHVAAAFAIGTVLAESGNDEFRWARRVLGYGIAVGTAYERLDHNVHWLSDTVAGAGIGFATARFVMHRRDLSRSGPAVSIAPFGDDGILLTYAIDLDR
jgi:membrane-associated phospholipid phosphatase